MTTTIEISRVITKISTKNNCGNVSTLKLSDMNKALLGLNEFQLTSTLKPSKFDKYNNIINNLGFCISVQTCNSAGFEGENSDVNNYKITYIKK
jgi:thiamine monophosphate kinase